MDTRFIAKGRRGSTQSSLGDSHGAAATASNEAAVDRAYSVFLCQSHKTVITVQCAVYSTFFAGMMVAGFAVANSNGINNTALGISNLTACDPGTADRDCSETARAQVNTNVWFTLAKVSGVTYSLQAALLIATAVMVRRPYFQERWRMVSTGLMTAMALVGPVFVNLWANLFLIDYDMGAIVALRNATFGDVRAVMLDTLVVGDNQRYSGLAALLLLSFAPRFREFCIVCCLLAICELIAELRQLAMLFDLITADKEAWHNLVVHFSFNVFAVPAFCVAVAYLVPVGVLWIFERMLRNSFQLQQMLRSRAKSLYKEARPFDVWTIKDWVETLAAVGGEDGLADGSGGVESDGALGNSGEGGVGSGVVIPMGINPSLRRHRYRKHPWELDSNDLVLVDVVGAGAAGKVYRGRYKGGDVAVKTLFVLPEDGDVDGAISDRLFADTAAEAEALSRLRHVNMMRFYGICFLAQQRSIAMVTELCALDLREWIDMPQGHSDEEVWRVASQVAQGLVHLHEDAGMVHRDLKPSNILLTQQGVVKLCDFGISSSRGHRARGARSTTAAAVEARGTTEYMAPECFDRQFKEEGDRGASSRHAVGDGAGDSLAALRPVDVYAFGCIAWELFARQSIWDEFGHDTAGVVQAVRQGERPDLSLASFCDAVGAASVRALIASCWAVDPRTRPRARGISEAVEALGERLTQREGASAFPSPPPPPPRATTVLTDITTAS